MKTRFARVDGNQRIIVKALEARGHRVQSIAAVGDGVPDLLVGARPIVEQCVIAIPKRFVVLEVKRIRNRRGDLEPLSEREAQWHLSWAGWPVYVVSTPEQAIAAVEGL